MAITDASAETTAQDGKVGNNKALSEVWQDPDFSAISAVKSSLVPPERYAQALGSKTDDTTMGMGARAKADRLDSTTGDLTRAAQDAVSIKHDFQLNFTDNKALRKIADTFAQLSPDGRRELAEHMSKLNNRWSLQKDESGKITGLKYMAEAYTKANLLVEFKANQLDRSGEIEGVEVHQEEYDGVWGQNAKQKEFLARAQGKFDDTFKPLFQVLKNRSAERGQTAIAEMDNKLLDIWKRDPNFALEIKHAAYNTHGAWPGDFDRIVALAGPERNVELGKQRNEQFKQLISEGFGGADPEARKKAIAELVELKKIHPNIDYNLSSAKDKTGNYIPKSVGEDTEAIEGYMTRLGMGFDQSYKTQQRVREGLKDTSTDAASFSKLSGKEKSELFDRYTGQLTKDAKASVSLMHDLKLDWKDNKDIRKVADTFAQLPPDARRELAEHMSKLDPNWSVTKGYDGKINGMVYRDSSSGNYQALQLEFKKNSRDNSGDEEVNVKQKDTLSYTDGVWSQSDKQKQLLESAKSILAENQDLFKQARSWNSEKSQAAITQIDNKLLDLWSKSPELAEQVWDDARKTYGTPRGEYFRTIQQLAGPDRNVERAKEQFARFQQHISEGFGGSDAQARQNAIRDVIEMKQLHSTVDWDLASAKDKRGNYVSASVIKDIKAIDGFMRKDPSLTFEAAYRRQLLVEPSLKR